MKKYILLILTFSFLFLSSFAAPPPPIYRDLGTFTVAGSASSATQERCCEFQSIWFQFTAVSGAPVVTFEVSTNGSNWRLATFAESQNTANVNSVTSPAVGYIAIMTLKARYWRITNATAATSVTVKVLGIN